MPSGCTVRWLYNNKQWWEHYKAIVENYLNALFLITETVDTPICRFSASTPFSLGSIIGATAYK